MIIAVGLLVGIALVFIFIIPQGEAPPDNDAGAREETGVPDNEEIGTEPEIYDPWNNAPRIGSNDKFATFDKTNTGTICGYIYDLSGRPIPLAEVTKDGPDDWRTTMADKNGFYELRLPAGRISRVKAVMTGYSANGAIISNLQVNEVRKGIDIYLGFGANAIAHVVNHATGRGVPGVMIRLYTSERTSNAYNRSAQETSDESGDIKYYSLGLHKYRITVRHKEYFKAGDDVQEVIIEPDKVNEFTIELNMGGVITGAVTDESRQPMTGARVWVTPAPNSPFPGPYRNETTDQEGKYRLTGLKTGDFKVICHKPGYVRDDKDTNVVSVVAGETITDMDFQLSMGIHIAGSVVSGEDGMPIEGATITVYGNGSYGSTRSGTEGSYKITGLKDGVFTVSANLHAKGYLIERAKGVRAGDEACNFTLSKGGTVKGRVYPGADVSFTVRMDQIEVEEGEEPYRRQRYIRNQDKSGNFELLKMKSGTYTIKVTAHGYSDSEVQTIHVVSERETEVVLELGPRSTNPKPPPNRPRITPHRRATGQKLQKIPGIR